MSNHTDSNEPKDFDEPHRWQVEPHPYSRDYDFFVTDNDSEARTAILEAAEMYLWDGNEGEERTLRVVMNRDIPAAVNSIGERAEQTRVYAPLERTGTIEQLDGSVATFWPPRASVAAVEGDTLDIFKNACRLHTSWTIDRYLMSNAVNRRDPAEKAERHIELCQFYVAAVRGCSLEDATSDHEQDFDRLHEESQELTSALDTGIGFPLDQTPDYADLNPKFFERFHAIACRVLGVSVAAASSSSPASPVQPTFVSEVDQWKHDLTKAEWTEESATAWYSPEGGLYRGPYGAWKELQRRSAAPLQPEGEQEREVQCADCFTWFKSDTNHTCLQQVRRNQRSAAK